MVSSLLKMSAGDYLLHRKMLQVENVHKKRTDFNDRKRVQHLHHMAAVRNDLQNERMILDQHVRQMPPGLRQFYWNNIDELDEEIKASKTAYPEFRGLYDNAKVASLTNVSHI